MEAQSPIFEAQLLYIQLAHEREDSFVLICIDIGTNFDVHTGGALIFSRLRLDRALYVVLFGVLKISIKKS